MTAAVKHKCDYCGLEFKTAKGLAIHDKRWCPWNGCPICTGGFGDACTWHFLP